MDQGGGEFEKADDGGDVVVKTGSKLSGAVKVLPAAFAYEDTAHQRDKLRAMLKEEDRLTDEISEGLDNVTLLASQHLSQRYPQLAKKETLDETDKEDGGGDAVEKVHTLNYRASVLVTHSNGNDSLAEDRAQRQEKDTKEEAGTENAHGGGEHTYANLGVTLVELTEKMKNVVSEMSSSGNSEEGEEDPRADNHSRDGGGNETVAAKALEGDDLPYIDEDASGGGGSNSNGSAAALDDAIAAASGLDSAQVVVSSLPEVPLTHTADTRVQQSRSGGKVVIVRSDLGEV